MGYTIAIGYLELGLCLLECCHLVLPNILLAYPVFFILVEKYVSSDEFTEHWLLLIVF